ncbi:hypothetical protein GCM10010389_07590 [Streptomyces echinoruber]|uniref:Uncharacterized protein n=1 Tax=Streptomyces echinoruber TaxID=68898 RepID=A0A918V661_9ACTN|nr:hypothetical protein GCM10010389_07590 [Streptomyces echinoruber]
MSLPSLPLLPDGLSRPPGPPVPPGAARPYRPARLVRTARRGSSVPPGAARPYCPVTRPGSLGSPGSPGSRGRVRQSGTPGGGRRFTAAGVTGLTPAAVAAARTVPHTARPPRGEPAENTRDARATARQRAAPTIGA